jgi:hypothetical protein
MASAALTPRVRAALVCEGIKPSKLEDGVFDLKGVRYAVRAPAFPFVPSRLWVFLVLSSPRKGRFPGTVRIVHDRTDRVVFMAHMEPAPEFQQEHDFQPVWLPLRCSFPEPGRYTIQVCFFQPAAGDVVKAEVPIDVQAEEG